MYNHLDLYMWIKPLSILLKLNTNSNSNLIKTYFSDVVIT